MLGRALNKFRLTTSRIQSNLSKKSNCFTVRDILETGAVCGTLVGSGLGLVEGDSVPFGGLETMAVGTIVGGDGGCMVGVATAIPAACIVKAPCVSAVSSIYLFGIYSFGKSMKDNMAINNSDYKKNVSRS